MRKNILSTLSGRQKFYEVQKYLTLTHHAYSPLILVMNKKKFDALTPELQQTLVSAAKEAGNYQRQLVAEDQQKILAGMQADGVGIITDPDREAFRNALGDQVRDMYLKDNPESARLLTAIDETH